MVDRFNPWSTLRAANKRPQISEIVWMWTYIVVYVTALVLIDLFH